MYFDTAEGPVFRPPSEADSFILRVTIGCSHNRCTYCNMYRSVSFRLRTMEEIVPQVERAKRYGESIRRVFLADGNALVLPTERLLEILALLRQELPKLRRVSCYAGPRDILNKTPEELLALREAGLQLVYYGLESGDDEVLQYVRKGVTAQQAVAAGQRIVAAGMKLSLMVIAGLGGRLWSEQHARHTALAINAIRPHMFSVLTLMMYRGSELRQAYEAGQFAVLSPAEIAGEMQALLTMINLPEGSHCLFRSNHISNYAPLAGSLPQDKDKLLAACRQMKGQLAGLTEWDPYNTVEE